MALNDDFHVMTFLGHESDQTGLCHAGFLGCQAAAWEVDMRLVGQIKKVFDAGLILSKLGLGRRKERAGIVGWVYFRIGRDRHLLRLDRGNRRRDDGWLNRGRRDLGRAL